MNERYRIEKREGSRLVAEGRFPLTVGGKVAGAMVVPEAAPDSAIAIVLLSDDRLWLRRIDASADIICNGLPVADTVQLRNGDKIAVGSLAFSVRFAVEATLFELATATGVQKVQPALEVAPLPFRAEGRGPRGNARRRWQRWLWGTVSLLFALLITAVWFVFSARQVELSLNPPADQIVIDGFWPAPRVGDHYLMQPGDYALKVSKACYQTFETRLTVSEAARQQRFAFELEKTPGRISVHAHPKLQPDQHIASARVLIDDRPYGMLPLQAAEVPAGRRQLKIVAPEYLDHSQHLEITGCNELQTLAVGLTPSWSMINIATEPTGAKVQVDGRTMGSTPLEFKLPVGTYDVSVHAEGRQSWNQRLTVEADQPVDLGTIALAPAMGLLKVRSQPAGASVTIGERYVGQTPLELKVEPGLRRRITIRKAGFAKATRTVAVASAQSKTIKVDLKPQQGIVYLTVEPGDSQLWVDGQRFPLEGPLRQRPVRLAAVEHQLELKKEGYATYRTRVTPRPDFPQELKIVLRPVAAGTMDQPTVIQAGNGYRLRLIRPAAYTMGSSRREQGRRSNETLRQIALKRPFYMGIFEVTNAQFRQFKAAHQSGSFKGHSLANNELPVVQVSWQQAARFCNWLSQRDGLPPAYVERQGKLLPAAPMTTGYRLPTEAEWEYCVRYLKGQAKAKYPWGNGFPPVTPSGNYADQAAKGLLTAYLASYHDGFAVAAAPGRFSANALGLYDFGGNVAEWCHDFYAIYPYQPHKVEQDPMGPQQGLHHVIKGAGWRDASISELRTAYRAYSQKQRDDLGFRICRYAEIPMAG